MYKSEQCFFRGVQYNDQVRPFQHNCSSSLALKYRWAPVSQSESPLGRSDPLLAWGHLDCEYGPCTPPCARQGGLWEQEGVRLIQWHFPGGWLFFYGRRSLTLIICCSSPHQPSTQSLQRWHQPAKHFLFHPECLLYGDEPPVIVTHRAQPCHTPAQEGLKRVHIGLRCRGTTFPSMQWDCWDL